MRDGKVELDPAGDEPPDRQNTHRLHDGIAEEDLLVDAFIDEAIDAPAQLWRDLDPQEIALQNNQAKNARGRRGFCVTITRVRKQVLAMVEERQLRQRHRPVERQRSACFLDADHDGR